MTASDPMAQGPLQRTAATRHGLRPGTPGAPVDIENREELIYTLGKAAELEHLIICQYLYAAFSLKRTTDEGVPSELEPVLKRWSDQLLEIGVQEMLHLALVQNLLTSIGAGPHLSRPNFPVPPRAFPARIQISLMPFSEAALRHFAFLERPDGTDMSDAEGIAALEQAWRYEDIDEDAIGPIVADFDTISHLYRSIENGMSVLAGRMGEERLFIGPGDAQASGAHFWFDELVEVTDLASAKTAIETIVEQGEGARGDWHEAHFGRLLTVLDEFLAVREANPGFEPARPVLLSRVRPLESGELMPLISAPFSVRCVDLMNAVYEVVLEVLARYFAHSDETDAQLATLAKVAIELMDRVVAPLGRIVTRLPVGPDHPGHTVGPSFELFYATDYLLPHRAAAWTLMVERLEEVAVFAVSCRRECPSQFTVELAKVSDKLREEADRLKAAS
ncbi:MAG TPA: ferritin-like protein [Candidatus Limnocylindrales bacterium]|nr:ferritin-like protein [Candidatus Limnocylindrales bacterium]